MKKLTVLALILASVFTGCQAPDKPVSNGFQVMAYFYPRGDDFDPDTLQLDRLTHIIFSFTEVIDNEMKFRDEARGALLRKLAPVVSPRWHGRGSHAGYLFRVLSGSLKIIISTDWT